MAWNGCKNLPPDRGDDGGDLSNRDAATALAGALTTPTSAVGRAPAQPLDLSPWRLRLPVAAGAGLVAAMASAPARGSSAALHGGWPQESTSPVASGPAAPAPLVELIGRRVAVTHADGRVTSGRLLAVDADRLLVVAEPDGDVVEHMLADLSRVRVLAPTDVSASPPEIVDEPATTNRAPATMGAGVALTMAGAAAMWTYRAGAIVELLAETRYNGANPVSHRVEGWTSLAWPLAIVGGALLTVGLPMWTVAGRDVEISATLAPCPIGERSAGAHGALWFEF